MTEWADDIEDWEYPDPDQHDDELVETVACPECGTEVYEEADCCPACGYFLTRADRTTSPRAHSPVKTGGMWLLLIILALALVGVFAYF